jgi:tetratricopeptide (TPR) repeat protein
MHEHREQLVFGVVLAVLGLLIWFKFDDAYVRMRVPGAGRFDQRVIEVPPEVLLAGPEHAVVGKRAHSLFEPPRELLPLDPLDLPEIPVPPLPVMRPTVAVAMAGSSARAYRIPAESLGALTLGASGGSVSSLDDEASLPDGFDTDNQEAEADEPDNSMRYDWVERIGSSSRVFGRILNDDPYGLSARLSEPIRFQQITTRTGRPLGMAFDLDRSVDVERFGLAQTFENQYHLESRSLGQGAGAVADRSDLALKMLAAADTEELALGFAEAEARLAHAASRLDPFTIRLLAATLHAARDLEGELLVYRDALDAGSMDAPLLADYAGLVLDLGLNARATELLDTAEGLSRVAAEVFYQRARLATLQGDHAAAVIAAGKAAGGHFSDPFRDRQGRQASLVLGRSLIAVGRLDDADREARRLLLTDPRDADALQLQGSVHAARSGWLDAADAFTAALLEKPADAGLLADMAVVNWRLGDGDEALRLLDQAADVDPLRAFGPLMAMGFVHEDAGDGQAARDLYDDALRLQPADPAGLYRLGRIERLDGDPEGAHRTLRQALRLGGPDVLLLSELGLCSLATANVIHAADYFAEALRLEPDNGLVLWLLGIAHLRQGDLLTAVERLEAATLVGSAGAHSALAVAHYRLGASQTALDHFDEVVRAFAGNDAHPMASYSREQADAIRDNLAKRQWIDTFGRSSLQRGWVERQWDGSPSLSHGLGKALGISGRMESPRDDERPGLSRTVVGSSFHSAELTAAALPGGDSRLGLVLTLKQVKGVMGQLPKGRLEIWLDEAGAIRIAALDNFETIVLPGDALPGLIVPQGATVRLGIERIDETPGAYGFSVDGRRVGPVVTLKALRDVSRNTLHLDVFGEAAPGRVCNVEVSRVRIVQSI